MVLISTVTVLSSNKLAFLKLVFEIDYNAEDCVFIYVQDMQCHCNKSVKQGDHLPIPLSRSRFHVCDC